MVTGENMNFNFLDSNITINRSEFSVSRAKESKLSQEDIDFINDDNIKKMLNRGEDFYQNKLAEISLDLADENLYSEAVNRVEQDGIFIIPNYLDTELTDKLCKIIEVYSTKYFLKLESSEIYEDSIALIQNKNKKLKGYSLLANYSKAVIDIRSGADEGMIDIFNVDKLIQDKSGLNILNDIIQDQFLQDLLRSLPQKLKISNINSYVNNGITSTRGFHVDSYSTQIKIFIYLTDVLVFDNGPYTFVKNTHLDTPYRRINRNLSKNLKAKTEAPVVPFANIYPILAPKGSLVVSDQSGFHRGFPQTNDGNRRVLTINCIQE